ncbi:MAG: hypothetical protein JWO94_2425 [Verrucomicrobiaceae bacterium]|nr:hypothetical protein [Verrucomicrobiaceae bacterium]
MRFNSMETESSLQYQPFAAVPELEKLREKLLINVPEHERAISLLTGFAAILTGLGQRSLGGVLLAVAGGAAIYRGATGHCLLYSALGKPAVIPEPVRAGH